MDDDQRRLHNESAEMEEEERLRSSRAVVTHSRVDAAFEGKEGLDRLREAVDDYAYQVAAERKRERDQARSALEILVADGIISAGRARELQGMSPEEQRKLWRRLAGGPANRVGVGPEARGFACSACDRLWSVLDERVGGRVLLVPHHDDGCLWNFDRSARCSCGADRKAFALTRELVGRGLDRKAAERPAR